MTSPPLTISEDVLVGLPGDDDLLERRRQSAAALAELEWPTAMAEEWRYSPIGKLDISAYPPVTAPGVLKTPGLAATIEAAARVDFIDGFVVSVVGSDSVDIPPASLDQLGPIPTLAIDAMASALAPSPASIAIKAGQVVAEPIVVSNFIATAGSSFPYLVVEAGENSEATVVVVHESNDVDALCVPRIVANVSAAARLRIVEIQSFGASVTSLGVTSARVADQATFGGWTGGLGGSYARHRLNCELLGRGSSIDYSAAYFGSEEQALDYRVFVDHIGADTTSNLAFSGAVDDKSTAIYTGMIRIHPEARGSNADQTNHNITLSEEAWAESVPNLEIENNDVHCSHASTVGPVDEDQMFYLESRGVPTETAEQLIVAGFFNTVIDAVNVPELAEAARAEIASRLTEDQP